MTNFYNLKNGICGAVLLASTSLFAQYNNGILIANEGNFGSPNASISYVDFDIEGVVNNVYQNVNDEQIGDVLQNIGLHEDYAYLVVNNSNKLIITNRATMEKVAEITENLNQPRYITFSDNKMYITCTGSQSVEVFNIDDQSHLVSIPMGHNVEQIQSSNDKVFVMDSWAGYASTLSVINTNTNTDEQTLNFDEGVQGIEVVEDKLYVLSSSNAQTTLSILNTENLEVISEIQSSVITNASKLSVDEDVAYFTANATQIYASVDGATEFDSEPIVTVDDNSWSTLYGFDVIDGVILSGDASGFVAPSVVSLYGGDDGQFLISFEAGIGTNGFYLNDEPLATKDVNFTKSEFTIAPNPVVSSFIINHDYTGVLSVYTTTGNLVKKIKYEGQKVNVSFLPTGSYVLTLETKEGTLTTKMIKK